MAIAEIRDHALWIKHIHGDARLTDRLIKLPAGTLIELFVDGHRGYWKKMDDGIDGRPTPGIKAVGAARDHWHSLQDKRGDMVEVVPI